MQRAKFAQLEETFRQCDLRAKGQKHKQGDEMFCTWVASGTPANHERLTDLLFDDADVKEFRF